MATEPCDRFNRFVNSSDYKFATVETTNDVRNVVLLVVVPRAYTIISFGSDQYYRFVHIVVEFHLHGNLDDLLLSPSTIFSSSP